MKIICDWEEFKSFVSTKNLEIQYEEISTPASYDIFADEEDIKYTCRLLKSSTDATDFETNYKDNANKPLVKKDAYGNPVFVKDFKTGSKITMTSHNYCDKTTWWMGATKILDETLTDSGDGLTFNFSKDFLINLDKVSMRDQVKSYGYMDIVNYNETTGRFSCMNIYVDGVLTSIGFTINHEAGTITFDSSMTGKVIKSDYYYAVSSKFTITPFPGKVLRLIETEVQTTIGAQMEDVFKFTIKAGGQAVHQQHYNSARDYLDASNFAYYSKPFLELTKDVVIIPWLYPITIDLKSSLGMTLELELLQNIPITNSEINTIAFYFVVEDE